MKKLLLTLAAGAFVATGAFAQASSLYLTGENLPGSNWSPENPITLPYTNNQYTYEFPENTTPTFKISTTKGGWDDFNKGALGTNNLKVNEKTQLSPNSANIVAPAPANYTMTITYENGNYWMLLATDDGETPEVVAPEKVYVKGTDTGWNANDSYVLDLTSNSMDKDGYYVYQGTIASLSGSFKLSGSATDWSAPINYGSGDVRTPQIGERIESWYDGQDFLCSGSFINVTLTFYWNPASGSPSYLYVESSVAPSYPETLYLIGNANGNVFAEGIGVAASSAADGVYTFNNITMAAADANTYGFFAFASDLTSWATINATRVAPAENDALIAAGDTQNIQLGVDASWKILPGTYSYTVDLVNKTLSVTGNADEQPTPDTPATLYIVGDAVNGADTWGTHDDSNVMTYNEANATYTWEGKSLAQGFKFNNGTWEAAYNIGLPDNAQVITIGQPITVVAGDGTQNLKVSDDPDTYIENPKVVLDYKAMTVTVTGTLKVPETPYVPEVIYLKGSFNNWGNDGVAATELKADGKGLYTASVEIPASQENIEFKLDAGNNLWLGCVGDQNITLTKGTPSVLEISASGNNWILNNWNGGTVEASVDWAKQTLTLTVSKESGIDSFNAANGEEVIYNLQGVRVSKSALTPGLYIINGKKVLVK